MDVGKITLSPLVSCIQLIFSYIFAAVFPWRSGGKVSKLLSCSHGCHWDAALSPSLLLKLGLSSDRDRARPRFLFVALQSLCTFFCSTCVPALHNKEL